MTDKVTKEDMILRMVEEMYLDFRIKKEQEIEKWSGAGSLYYWYYRLANLQGGCYDGEDYKSMRNECIEEIEKLEAIEAMEKPKEISDEELDAMSDDELLKELDKM